MSLKNLSSLSSQGDSELDHTIVSLVGLNALKTDFNLRAVHGGEIFTNFKAEVAPTPNLT